MNKPLGLYAPTQRSPLLDRIITVFRRELGRHGGPALQETKPDQADLKLTIEPQLGSEAYRITTEGAQTVVAGGDERGLLYGIGKLLRTSAERNDGFTLSTWRGNSQPARSVRAVYFATHFHNYYHAGPVKDIEEYVESLALWGCNTLAVWFDMHHFDGIDDPAAQDMIERLRAILSAAKQIGIQPALLFLANEGYANSQTDIRADGSAGQNGYFAAPGGFYNCEVCPSSPGGLEYILKTREQVLEVFSDLDIGYVCMWPYDQGGCTCAKCAPWGANGFLRCAEELAPLVQRKLPGAKQILSTWYFDHFTGNEWEGLHRIFDKDAPVWLDYLLADDNADQFPQYPLEKGIPGNLPLVSFPEISMYRMSPWGGYGANPLPTHLGHVWRQASSLLQGGFPYSEGIYEDINKAVVLQLFWNDRDPLETVHEYAAYEYGAETAAFVVEAVRLMEDAQINGWQNGPFEHDALNCLEEAEVHMSAERQNSWQWRILRRRSEIDRDLLENKGTLTRQSRDAVQELVEIYHAENSFVGNAKEHIK